MGAECSKCGYDLPFMQDCAYCEMEQRALRAEGALAAHEKCIEEIDADQLAMAERENELHDEKDVALKAARDVVDEFLTATNRVIEQGDRIDSDVWFRISKVRARAKLRIELPHD
jgi:predicted ABC-type ATPase